jgi:hypothetical protein
MKIMVRKLVVFGCALCFFSSISWAESDAWSNWAKITQLRIVQGVTSTQGISGPKVLITYSDGGKGFTELSNTDAFYKSSYAQLATAFANGSDVRVYYSVYDLVKFTYTGQSNPNGQETYYRNLTFDFK